MISMYHSLRRHLEAPTALITQGRSAETHAFVLTTEMRRQLATAVVLLQRFQILLPQDVDVVAEQAGPELGLLVLARLCRVSSQLYFQKEGGRKERK